MFGVIPEIVKFSPQDRPLSDNGTVVVVKEPR